MPVGLPRSVALKPSSALPPYWYTFIDALENGDTNVLLPWLMVTAIFIILFNLLADVMYGVLDPRIRLT